MARKYVLGPNAAREFKRLIRGSGEVSRRQNQASAFAFDSEFVFPFTVQWAQSVGESGSWIIWLPSDSLLFVKGKRVDVAADLEPVEGDYPDGWFVLTSSMIDRASGGTLYLNITTNEGDSSGEVEDESDFDVTVEFSSEDGCDSGDGGASPDEDDDDSVVSIKVCEAFVGDGGARSVKQFVSSVLSFGDDGVEYDDVSIGAVKDEDSEKKGAIEIFDFDNNDSDGEQGLAERLELEKVGSGESASYKIKAKANDSSVHLIARVNGKIKYIPISGKDEKDPDEENDERGGDPCAHPGDNDDDGGVSPDDGVFVDVDFGGVEPESGGVHPGDDGCNCDR